MRNLQLLLPVALGALTLSGCVYDEPYDSGSRYYEGRPAYRGSARYERDYDPGYERRDVVIETEPYYAYDGVEYYYSDGRYYYNRGPRRIYIDVLPRGGRYLGHHDHDDNRHDRNYDRDDRRSYYSGSRYREDSSSSRREQEIRNYEAQKAQDRNRGIASVDQQKARERQYDLQRQQKVQSYDQQQTAARARYIQEDKEGTSHKKKKDKDKKKDE